MIEVISNKEIQREQFFTELNEFGERYAKDFSPLYQATEEVFYNIRTSKLTKERKAFAEIVTLGVRRAGIYNSALENNINNRASIDLVKKNLKETCADLQQFKGSTFPQKLDFVQGMLKRIEGTMQMNS